MDDHRVALAVLLLWVIALAGFAVLSATTIIIDLMK